MSCCVTFGPPCIVTIENDLPHTETGSEVIVEDAYSKLLRGSESSTKSTAVPYYQ